MCCSGNSWKIPKYMKLICSQYTLLANINLFASTSVKSGKLIIGLVCIIARLVFLFCFALATGHCNVFQNIFGNENTLEFCGPNFQTMLFLVTMAQIKKIYLKPPFFKWTVTTDTTHHNINGYILIVRLAFWVQVVKITSKALIGLRATKIRYFSLKSLLFGYRSLT